ncbi:MAG: glycosyltransferase [Candidatus Krumholzibacteriota bacterium]|nr:glycosyltransferase [Candidatus Krumholzibacteriota bacterium]
MTLRRKDSKLLILCSTLVTGGAEIIVKALCSGLPELGISPVIICLKEPGEVGESISSSGVELISGLSRSRFDPSVFFKLIGIMKKYPRAGILVIDHHDAVFWGAIASKFVMTGKKVLCSHSTGLWSTGRSFSWTDRLVLPAYDRIVALAENHREHLSKKEGISGDRIVIINNGIDIARFHPVDAGARAELRRELGISADDFVVTILAALRPEKNHKMFIDAASMLIREEDGPFRFLVVGEGEMEAELKNMTEELLPEGVVRFLGRRDDTEKILSISDVSVLSSYPVVETFPLTVLEAMASALPVISTSVGSIPEMLVDGEEGLLIESEDTEALVKNLMLLKNDNVLRERIGTAARKRVVRDFSVERMINGYAGIFSE